MPGSGDDCVRIKAAIVGRQPIIRYGLRQMLSLDPAIKIVAETDDIDGLESVPGKIRYEIVLLELEDSRDVLALRRLCGAIDNLRVIVYASKDNDVPIAKAMGIRIDGYLQQGFERNDLLSAIRLLNRGGASPEPHPTEKVVSRRSVSEHTNNSFSRFHLSKRETEVLQLLASGKTNRSIGEQLSISESTVKFHMHAILHKLDASNRTEAVSIAAQRGLVELNVSV